jgi:hypothetical protein
MTRSPPAPEAIGAAWGRQDSRVSTIAVDDLRKRHEDWLVATNLFAMRGMPMLGWASASRFVA